MTLHLFTYGTDYIELHGLMQSARISRCPITYILATKWNGYIDKILKLREMIRNIPNNDVICFVDAYDVLSFADENEILQKFLDYNCNLVISAELNCYPVGRDKLYDAMYKKTGMDVPTKFKFVNSGGYIGYKHAIMDLFQWKTDDKITQMSDETVGGDQNYFTEYFLANAPIASKKVKLDMNQQLFQSIYKVHYDELKFESGRLYNKVLDVNPCFLHFNGYKGYHYLVENMETGEHVDVRKVLLDKMKLSFEKKLNVSISEYRSNYVNQFGGTTSHYPQI